MILARCPECGTTFRVTPEQLKARAGKVRCGQCHGVFNALDALVEAPRPVDSAAEPVMPAAPEAPTAPEAPAPPETPEAPLPPPAEPSEMAADVAPAEALATSPETSAEDVVQAGQAAGLIAARETRELPGYNKWAERPLSGLDGGFDAPARGPRRLFVLFALLLALALLAQAAYHFRTEIATRWPELRPILADACAHLGCTVPLPHVAELLSIEGSELQADAERGGLLVLRATLKNRAAFAQPYPLLELTLTDVQDRMVVRRVLTPPDYLPASVAPGGVFAAGAELSTRLWIDAGDSGAAGYRLYVFFP